jgi:phage repressor protein C with HTH and peptisase S24 domain
MSGDLYKTLVALKPHKLSLAAWARKAGVCGRFFQNIKKGNSPDVMDLGKILAVVASSGSLIEYTAPAMQTGSAIRMSDFHAQFRAIEPARSIPLFETSMGGGFNGLEVDIELTLMDMFNVRDHILWPPDLVNYKGIYALTIMGDSMWPRFRLGRRIVVRPQVPLAMGDDVVVHLHRDNVEEGRGVKPVLIKEIVRRTPTYVELRQFNPDVTFCVEARHISAIDKVMGELF